MRFFIFIFILAINIYAKPHLLLLETYKDQNITGWLMSEKLDGIRAFWDGKELLSKNGKKLYAPSWFLEDFPPFSIDGELWIKRGSFEKIQSIVMDKMPSDEWSTITYNIFEVPNQKGGLLQRLAFLEQYLKTHKAPYIKIIPQYTCKDKKHLQKFFDNIVNNGGEGVVLRNPQSSYINKRTKNALKMKLFKDDECVVESLHKGHGKYKHLLGSFTCKLDNNITFKIGSGLSNKERDNYIHIGDTITFKHQGFTHKGKPKFPVFLRVRKK